ncbi:MAG: MBOAT family protein [Bacteroidales bacterium]|nr:MBOAT family protein [Bacteroidales bacterium]
MISGLVLGIGVLFYFKYLGVLIPGATPLLNVIGISFFTFKLLGYVVDTYLGKMSAVRNIIDFGAYVAFFPTILSGPIDRPGEFIPQLERNRNADWDGIAEGFRRVVWGLFLKLCIADRIKAYPDAVFGNVGYHNTTSIILAAILYAIEMYADFAGYSEMAIGVGRIMGFKVRENFLRPFFAQNVSEYWRRWHMSLTSWITDYVYMPLNVAFRGWGKWGLYLATSINVILIGIWHGAQWGYLLFGIWHSLFLILAAALEKNRKTFEKKHKLKGKWYYKTPRRVVTFIIVACGLVIFRTESLSDLTAIVSQCGKGFGPIFTNGLLEIGTLGLFSILLLFFKEMKDENGWSIHFLHSQKTWLRLASMAILFAYVIFAGELKGSSFIYFQF